MQLDVWFLLQLHHDTLARLLVWTYLMAAVVCLYDCTLELFLEGAEHAVRHN